MAASNQSVGVDHMTTVPTNFDPDESAPDDGKRED